MKTIKECYKTEEWEYQKALEDVIKLIDEMQQEFSNMKVNPHKVYAKPYQIYDSCIKKIEELKARMEG